MSDDTASAIGQRGIRTEQLDSRSLKKRGGGGAGVLLVLLLLVLAGVVVLYFVAYRPMEATLGEMKGKLTQAQAAADGAAALREELDGTHAELAEAQTELERLRAESESLASASEEAAQRASQLEEQTDALRTQLEEEIARGEILLRDDRGRLTVALADRVLFASGQAELNERGQRILRRLADTLRGMEDKVIQVGGHSDNVAIPDDSELPFANNWELSSARATAVVRFLQEECEIEGERLVAIGYNEFRPVASNRSPAGRRRNRRIDLVLAPREE